MLDFGVVIGAVALVMGPLTLLVGGYLQWKIDKSIQRVTSEFYDHLEERYMTREVVELRFEQVIDTIRQTNGLTRRPPPNRPPPPRRS